MYNHIGSFVRSGLIDERTYSIKISGTNRPHIFENFEYLARRANRWVDAHPGGDYPSSERRLLPAVETSPDV
jgi:hypothetical protein